MDKTVVSPLVFFSIETENVQLSERINTKLFSADEVPFSKFLTYSIAMCTYFLEELPNNHVVCIAKKTNFEIIIHYFEIKVQKFHRNQMYTKIV